MCQKTKYLLICTVGGDASPILKSVEHWKPERVILVPSIGTRAKAQLVVERCDALSDANVDFKEVSNHEDMTRCVEEMRCLTPTVEEWRARGDGFKVVVDPTGGTKVMTAAMALVSRRWPCIYSYVGGNQRSKDGIGIVLDGFESVVKSANPLDFLGYQALEDACLLFDQLAFRAGAEMLEGAAKRASAPSVTRMLSTFAGILRAYDAWDRFHHSTALKLLGKIQKNANDCKVALGEKRAAALLEVLERHQTHLKTIDASRPSHGLLVDLLANARRRHVEGRYDDGVARLYRVVEAKGQLRLLEEHNQDAGGVTLEFVPVSLRDEWRHFADEAGVLRPLGLRSVYELLQALNDPLGKTFEASGLATKKRSMLDARNRSVLAHGFEPISDKTFECLWKAALEITGVSLDELPVFPQLAASAGCAS